MVHLSEPEKLPPKDYRQRIEKLAEQISDPVRKLKFLHQALADYSLDRSTDATDRKSTEPETKGEGEPLLRKSRKNGPPGRQGKTNGFPLSVTSKSRRYLLYLLGGVGIVVCGLAMLIFLSNGSIRSKKTDQAETRPDTEPYHYIIPMVTATHPPEPILSESVPEKRTEEKPPFPEYLDTVIWMIEKTTESEYYSNRLRIYTAQTTDNTPRRYYRTPINADGVSEPGPETEKVVGILFHAAESDIYEFKPEMTQSIKEYSRLLIRYIRKKKAYHYFIDRFGQVYRLVREDHAANHAGNAIWMDSEAVYLDLNNAFIGICFEGKDFENIDREKVKVNGNGARIIPMARSSINEAQLRSGKELTDWLRVKYHIPQHNCVPHCLVSVNPYDLLIGHHLDLSYEFPFDMFGLSNKYEERIPAITEFGFSCNNYFVEVMKGRLWPGIIRSEEYLRQRADQQKIPLKDYRRLLNTRFTRLFKWQKEVKNSEAP